MIRIDNLIWVIAQMSLLDKNLCTILKYYEEKLAGKCEFSSRWVGYTQSVCVYIHV